MKGMDNTQIGVEYWSWRFSQFHSCISQSHICPMTSSAKGAAVQLQMLDRPQSCLNLICQWMMSKTQDSHARKAKDGSCPHGVHSKTAWLKLTALFSWEALRLPSSRPAEVYNNCSLQWQAVSTWCHTHLMVTPQVFPQMNWIRKPTDCHWLSEKGS